MAVTVNAVYFVKYRPVALGISTAGAGVGNVFYSWVSTRLIASLGWRGEVFLKVLSSSKHRIEFRAVGSFCRWCRSVQIQAKNVCG